MEATSDGSSLSGTAAGAFNGDTFTITLQCLRQFDDQTWMFAGELTKSAVPDRPDGSWATVIVRDGSPQKAGIWLQERGTADDCEEFVEEAPDSAVEGPEMIGDLSEGSVTLPPAPAGNDVSGQVTFSLDDTPVTVDVGASADGTALSGQP
jgi:hypothetical protein